MKKMNWHKVLEKGDLAEGRVTTVTAGVHSICLTHYDGQYSALCNHCPHQGGPMGEGSIENGVLRCPWHGWDFDPITGKAPGSFEDGGLQRYPLEERDDGIYVGIEEEEPHVRTHSDVMAESLVNWGVKHIFGMVGHSNLGMADALRMQEEEGHLQFIGIRHEGAASFACSAYGKLTNRVAACFTIAGPGATNLMTGLYDAKVDRAPMLAMTGQVDTQVLGPGAFQEVDLAGVLNDVAFWKQTVLSGSRHGELVNLAMKNALIQRGPVALIIPNEVQEEPALDDAPVGSPEGRLPDMRISPPVEALADAIEKISNSKRPLFILGHGARFHSESIIELAEKLDAAMVTTFKGKGIVSDHHPLGGGVLGRSGTPIASWLMNESDLLVVIGASFSNHTGIAPYKEIIQIDFDPMHLGKFHSVTNPVWGEIGVTVEKLNQAFPEKIQRSMAEDVAKRWTIWREEKQKRLKDDQGKGISSVAIFETLNTLIPEDAIIAADVGNNTYSFGRYFESSGKQAVLMSGYLGSIGFSLPAAMGAWAATTEEGTEWFGRKVISISGDGGFGQYLGELLTAVKYNMNICHVLLHNSQLGKITKEQRAGEFEVWKTDLHNPNFAEYAQNCGAMGLRVEKPEDLEAALSKGISHQGPALVEIMTDALLV